MKRKITNKTKLSEYLALKLLSDFTDEAFENMPISFKYKRKQLPTSIWDIKFEQFVEAHKYSMTIMHAPLMLEVITSVNNFRWEKSKITLSLVLWLHYKSEIEQVMKMFQDVADELPKAKTTVKTMEEFGLHLIVRRLANGRAEVYKTIYNWSVSEVYVEYRAQAYELVNKLADEKSNKRSS